ncbi:MAG: glycosyltransferase family 1 protein [Alphaproteobacteria bacterium]|nr:glycosyltransferase family 1 protein [Alphaproteobacteria bacterium]
MKPLRIVHCANFNTVRLKGCYMASMGYKLNNGLIRLGHQVMCYSDRDMSRLYGIMGKKIFLSNKKNNENFKRFCLNLKPDIILFGHADVISAQTIAEIRAALPHVQIVQWNVDPINPEVESGRHNIKNIISKLDVVDYTLITTGDKNLFNVFNPQKHKIGFIPNPVDKSIETAKVFENENPMYDVFFASSPQVLRDLCGELVAPADVATLLEQNCPQAKLHFPRINAPSVDGVEYLEKLAQSAMVLNLSRTNDYLYSSDRMAHAMGNGCLALIDRRTGFNKLISEDEAGFYSTKEEMIDKINLFIKYPQKRMETAQKGWLKYHELFSETKIAAYLLSLLDGSFKPQDYPFSSI